MKKRNLESLIVLGLLSGSLLTGKVLADTKDSKTKDNSDNPVLSAENGNMGYHLMTEDELLMQLNSEGTKIYQSLTPEGKKLALKVASSSCNDTNECKGLNACRTEKNTCAGKGECKARGKCAISDPNLAIKLVQKKMAEKRENAQNK